MVGCGSKPSSAVKALVTGRLEWPVVLYRVLRLPICSAQRRYLLVSPRVSQLGPNTEIPGFPEYSSVAVNIGASTR
jgi:hypothetical protein